MQAGLVSECRQVVEQLEDICQLVFDLVPFVKVSECHTERCQNLRDVWLFGHYEIFESKGEKEILVGYGNIVYSG